MCHAFVTKLSIVRKTVSLFFTLIMACLITSCAIQKQQETPSKAPFGIIFGATINGNADLYRISSPDFQSMEQLTFTPKESETSVYINKGFSKLIFNAFDGMRSKPVLLDIASKKASYLGGQNVGIRGWTPNDNEVILSTNKGIVTTTLDGKETGALSILYTFQYSVFDDIRYSPSGKLIAYTESHQPKGPPYSLSSVFLFDVTTKQVISLIDNPKATCNSPAWSSRGGKLLIYCDLDDQEETDGHIYLFEAPENNPAALKKIADNPFPSFCSFAEFYWSPIGDHFISNNCTKKPDAEWSIYKADGSKLRDIALTDTSGHPLVLWSVTWSPDGQQIVYATGSDEKKLQVYIMNMDGTNNRPIITTPGNYYGFITYPLTP